MPVCDICGEEVETAYRCKKCGEPFCSECGSVEEGICIICQAELEEEALE